MRLCMFALGICVTLAQKTSFEQAVYIYVIASKERGSLAWIPLASLQRFACQSGVIPGPTPCRKLSYIFKRAKSQIWFICIYVHFNICTSLYSLNISLTSGPSSSQRSLRNESSSPASIKPFPIRRKNSYRKTYMTYVKVSCVGVRQNISVLYIHIVHIYIHTHTVLVVLSKQRDKLYRAQNFVAIKLLHDQRHDAIPLCASVVAGPWC